MAGDPDHLVVFSLVVAVESRTDAGRAAGGAAGATSVGMRAAVSDAFRSNDSTAATASFSSKVSTISRASTSSTALMASVTESSSSGWALASASALASALG
eukprot:CAMPEP_0194305146 /NCGR_PEP_ID=MMETSP0171-20130528/2648_1 /TAXON_ID=218684 /ORGANISM="Corethron pennatum, Strain L29A3" /LENGTH=100 /DNA_ID=CAMNT_0039056581 /DNA_START=461 /DNA_END=764 /DNA_ORIENTATION=-